MAVAQFRSRARVIDLLGRQQISDAPTACGELFKNSLDAGARHVWVDYQEEVDLLMVRDDGLGMRLVDVLDKWLVLATESRFQTRSVDDGWSKYADEEQLKWLNLPSYGEKGIGRLSVSTLSRMTLLYSVWGQGQEKRAVLCLVHWHLFQHPTKLFEDLPIPYQELKTQPTLEDIRKLWEEFRNSDSIKELISDSTWDQALRSELESDVSNDTYKSIKLETIPFEAGTTFFLIGITKNGQVPDLFLKPSEDLKAHEDYTPDQLKSIHAFSTFWDPFHKHKSRQFKLIPAVSGTPLKKTFRFWQASDFKDCDQHIRIHVSAEGFAKGTITYYDGSSQEYSRQLKNLPARSSSPGEFLIDIGYLEGRGGTSKVPDDIHTEMDRRLQHAGGFSIYIGNVRVQPYGSIDSDFAGFETRRAKNAGRYYFSTLRMFGGVFFESKAKTDLKEKAGREGFVINGATRGLRLWLEDVFVDLADSYLGRKADRQDKKDLKRKRLEEAAKKRIEQERTAYIKRVKDDKKRLAQLKENIKKQVIRSRHLIATERNAGTGKTIEDIETNIQLLRSQLRDLRGTASEPPNGVALQGDELDSVEQYITDRYNAIQNLTSEVENLVRQSTQLQERILDKKRKKDSVSRRIEEADLVIRKEVEQLIHPALTKAETLESDIKSFAEQEISKATQARMEHLLGLSPDDIVNDNSGANMAKLEKALNSQAALFEEECKPRLLQLVDDLVHLTDQSSAAVLATSQAKELQLLKERHAYIVEMAQMGLIVEAASHEYEKQVSNIRTVLKKLKTNIDPRFTVEITSLSDSFDIIDHRIRLIDPLIRRRTGSVAQLTGQDIVEFLEQRFPDYFRDKTISATKAFCAVQFNNIKRAVFLGAIHNIVDNAIFWSSNGRGDRKILLSGSDLYIVISDNGPGVQKSDRDKIFEPGFSRRPYGRGLGLYIAREALRGIGFDLYTPSQPELGALEGANFIIIPKSNSITDED
ncbi:MAG: ATP-binding protein [Verrucomicrobiota bacterium]